MKESCADLKQQLLRLSLEMDHDQYIVWRRDNPDHPRNWALARKVFDIGLSITYNLIVSVFQNKSDVRGD